MRPPGEGSLLWPLLTLIIWILLAVWSHISNAWRKIAIKQNNNKNKPFHDKWYSGLTLWFSLNIRIFLFFFFPTRTNWFYLWKLCVTHNSSMVPASDCSWSRMSPRLLVRAWPRASTRQPWGQNANRLRSTGKNVVPSGSLLLHLEKGERKCNAWSLGRVRSIWYSSQVMQLVNSVSRICPEQNQGCLRERGEETLGSSSCHVYYVS